VSVMCALTVACRLSNISLQLARTVKVIYQSQLTIRHES